MGKYLGIIVIALTFLVGSVAHSATFNADPDASRATFKLGGLAGITVPRSGTGTATLTGTKGQYTLNVTGPIWKTTNFGPGTSLFTGVPFISNLVVTMSNPTLFSTANSSSTKTDSTRVKGIAYNNTVVANPMGPGNMTDMVGFGGMNGQAIIDITIGTKRPVSPLTKAGLKPVATGTVKIGTPAVLTIDVTYGPWHKNAITMTNVTTNYVQMPGRNAGEQTGLAFTLNPKPTETQRTFTVGGNFITSFPDNELLVATEVTIGGTSNFPSTASGTGTISLVTPLRLITGEVAGTLPAFLRMKFSFVPEPGTLLLLTAGAVGLVVVGRKRTKK